MAMIDMFVQSLSLEITIVSCIVTNTDGQTNGLILMYSGSTVIHKIPTSDPVTCMVFGKFGQEENALIMISSSKKFPSWWLHTRGIYNKCSFLLGGKLDIKLLKRTATFDLCIRSTITTPSHGNLNIPKRSNVFIEQTLREREQCKGKYIDNINLNVLTFYMKFFFVRTEMHVRTQQAWQTLQTIVLNERINSIKQKITNQFLHTSAQVRQRVQLILHA